MGRPPEQKPEALGGEVEQGQRAPVHQQGAALQRTPRPHSVGVQSRASQSQEARGSRRQRGQEEQQWRRVVLNIRCEK